ncbi:serine O-acetyltransferase, partial [Halobacteriales archaeon QS_9_67_15]
DGADESTDETAGPTEAPACCGATGAS